ncbi:MAG TPA: hypothetical protein VIH42_13500 [Thermoguttaceae bacterium]
MFGKFASAGVLGLLALCVGCTMCCHPYDYSGPVYDSSGQSISDVRAGSILIGGPMQQSYMTAAPDMIVESTPVIEQDSSPVEEYEGATQILSITDHKVEDTEEPANTQPESEESQPILAQPIQSIRR